LIEVKNTLETLFEAAKEAGLPVALDASNSRLVFATSNKEEFSAVFHFMDKHKVNGMAYPVTFAVYGRKEGGK